MYFNIENNFEKDNHRYSALCYDFLHMTLMVDPKKRASAAQLLNHDWLKNNVHV